MLRTWLSIVASELESNSSSSGGITNCNDISCLLTIDWMNQFQKKNASIDVFFFIIFLLVVSFIFIDVVFFFLLMFTTHLFIRSLLLRKTFLFIWCAVHLIPFLFLYYVLKYLCVCVCVCSCECELNWD